MDPANFVWYEIDSRKTSFTTVSRVEYEGTGYFFEFDLRAGNHYTTLCPSGSTTVGHRDSRDWASQTRQFREWLAAIQKELDNPDPWGRLHQYRIDFMQVAGDTAASDQFTFSQVKQIKETLGSLESEIARLHDLTDDDRAFVRGRLDYLAEASERQRKGDWMYTCIGVIVTISSGLSLAPEEAAEIWAFLKDGLSVVLQLITG